ncbi:hypothetical protein OLMES_0264 [Oleiphilus messinensis]|uniref:DUF4214 domain-containing protein n=1 Tax=Oleiphilus messinensis TaxID=141451 RepID=A0A1Y0I284_9GAMM|nr:DUF4214 domain-containing protein [Oleiphilus messinensis]ARU54370.1 hypothetical protein OLMES_0264 [Oleiphilus messinensis]
MNNHTSGFCTLITAIFFTAWSVQASAQCAVGSEFSMAEETVLEAYIGYYGRPADPDGLAFWSQILENQGGRLDSIIDAFGRSSEFDERFGNLDNGVLVTNLYEQLFARTPDDAGLAFWVGELDTGASSLQSVTLNILGGAQNSDVEVLQNRTLVSKFYIEQRRSLSLSAEPSADQLAMLVASVTENPETATAACIAVTALLTSLDERTFSALVLDLIQNQTSDTAAPLDINGLNLDMSNEDDDAFSSLF